MKLLQTSLQSLLLSFVCAWCLHIPTAAFSQEQPPLLPTPQRDTFSKVPVFDKSYARTGFINTSTTSVTITSLNFVGGDFAMDSLFIVLQTSQSLISFRKLPITLASGDTLLFLAIFQPFRQGTQSANLRIGFRRSGGTEEALTWNNFVSGYGIPVGIYSAPKTNGRDWLMPSGSSSVRSVVLRNLVGSSKQIRKIEIVQSGNDFALDTIIPPPDSVDQFAVIPIRFTSSQSFGIRPAVLKIIVAQGAILDTLEQQLGALGRFIGTDDAVIRPGLRAMRDSLASGDSLTLEVFLSEAEKQKLARVTSSSMRALIAVYKNNVLPLSEWYNNQWQARELPIQKNSPWRIFEITGEGRFGSAWNGRDDVLMRMSGRALISETDQSPLHLLDFQWLVQGEINYIVQLPAQSGSLTVQTCAAGGKRLFTPSKTTAFALQSPFPNPVNTDFAVTYTVSEKQHLSLALYNAQGNLVRTIKSALHEPGEYSERLETGFLATGTYFVRLAGGAAVEQRVVNVIK